MIAEVVLNSNSRATDNIYHYLVPKTMESAICIGLRVSVPFGKGDKTSEAYVVGFVDTSEFDKLKEIKEIVDDYCYFDEYAVELVKFMRHRYFCSYISAIRAVMPGGVGLHITRVVHPCTLADEGMTEYLAHHLYAGKIYSLVCDSPMSIEEITSELGGKNAFLTVKEMAKRGIVTIEEKLRDGIKDSYAEIVNLNLTEAEAREYVQKYEKKAKSRVKVIKALMENNPMGMKELVDQSGASRQVIKALLDQNVVSITKVISKTNLYDESYEQKYHRHTLTDDQRKVADRVFDSVKNGEKKTFLLKGVTGSGKTEVYLDLIERTIAIGKQAVFLVPEIALTPQMVGQVMARFGDNVAVIHSSLTPKQRFEQWKRINDGQVDIVVGARSAVFAPFKNIGLFIIDEEHENTYKSEMTPKYITSEIARFRSNNHQSVVLLASATPLVESTYRAQSGKFEQLFLNQRIGTSKLPKTEIVDMRNELAEGNMSIFSTRLVEEMAKNLESGKQTILFLNRRGFSSFVSCRECGYVAECPNCNVSLTYHKSINKMVCHYCDYAQDVPKVCPSCSGKHIKFFGIGTQKVADELGKLFPKARVIRMDADTTSERLGHEQLLRRFENREADILVGTQMVTKGLDFENVTLVGIIAADMSLNMDDFRAAERTFDLITQVSGRAGRGEYEGLSIIQTYNPDNETIQSAARQNYDEFYNDEIELRRLLIYPPFCEFIHFVFTADGEKSACNTAKAFFAELASKCKEFNVYFYPVSKAPLFKVNNKYRYRFLLKCGYSKQLYDIIWDTYNRISSRKGSAQIIIDVNPSNMY